MIRNLTRFLAAIAVFASVAVQAQISYSGAVYSQNFDTLPGGANNTLNAAWIDNATLPGWYANKAAFTVTDGTVGGTAAAFDSTSTTANNAGLFSFGAAGSADRALGSRATASFAGNDPVLYGVRLVNNTTQTLTRFTVIYTGEQWFKSSAAAAHALLLDYQLGAAGINTGTWTAAVSGTFTAPIATGTTATALSGNIAANRTAKSAVVSGILWAPGQELWVRFRDAEESGNEQGLAVDDFSFTADNESGLYFNGLASSVTMGAATATLGASNFTIECRFLKTGAGTTASTGTGGVIAVPLVAKGRSESDGSNVDCNYFLGIDANNRLCADFEQLNATNNGTAYAAGQNFPVTGSSTLENGIWYHAAATYDTASATWKLYLNGVAETLTTTLPAFAGVVPRSDSIQHFGIGTTFDSTGTASGAFQGIIDEVRVWNVARTAAAILANKDVKISAGSVGLLGRYGFDEGSGTAVAGIKAAGAAPNGTLAGTTLPQWVNAAIFAPNNSPSVEITSPADDADYDAPAAFTVTVDASDSDGTVAKVEFFAGSTKIGEDLAAPYALDLSNVFSGLYFISAKATDNSGASTTSGVIEVFVTNANNAAPSVALTAPLAGATAVAGSTVTLAAIASDTDGFIAKVQFYLGNTLLGEDAVAPYTFDWSSPSIVGGQTITAAAIDNDGGTASSSAVVITLTAAPPFSYSQNFDSMGASGTALPAGWSMFNGNSGTTNATWTTTIPGTGTNSVASMVAAAGGLTVNNAPTATNNNGYNALKPGTTTDRIVATSPTTVDGVAIQLQLTNTTGASIFSLQLGFDTQRFLAVATANELPGYWVFSSLDNGATWTNLPAFNPTLAGPAGIIVPNTVGVTTFSPIAFTLSGPWASGASLLLRWVDDNAVATSPDQILGLNNVTISAPSGGAPVGAPTSSLTSPVSSATFTAPATINLAAAASDTNGTIVKVEFYQGVTKLGEDAAAPYSFAWTGVAAGSYSLTVIATDNDGNTAGSTPVTITVNPAPGSGTLTRGPYLQKAAPTQMTVRWRSSQSVAGRVQFGTTEGDLNQVMSEASAVTEHIVTLPALSANTTYFYSIGSAFDTIASGPTFTFTTPPVAGTVIPARIWVLGDAGTANANQTQVRDAFYTWTGTRTPSMVLQLGDNAYNSGTDAEFQSAVFDIYPTMLRKTPFWSCLGNHETAQATAFADTYPYFNLYTFPTGGECGGVASGTEHYYSWDYSNIHFISLDSMTANRSPTGAMANWLANDLASTTATWIICIFHHPPYTKGSHNSDTETELVEMRTNILPILEAGGVDLVLSGHSHCYERSYLLDKHYGSSTTLTSAMKLNAGSGRPGGTGAYIKPLTGPRDHFGAVYSVAGSAGQASGGSLNHPAHYISLNSLGSLVLDINGTRLDATFVKSDGTTPDTFTIIQQGAADSDGDGMSDEFEITNGLDRHNLADASLDSDGDGLTNLQEFQSGTNPNNAADKPRIASLAMQANGSVVVQIPTAAGKNYRLEANNNFPAAAWSLVANSIAGTGGLVPVADPGAAGISNRIYRLTVLP